MTKEEKAAYDASRYDPVKAAAYVEANKVSHVASMAVWYEEHKEEVSASSAAWAKANREKKRAAWARWKAKTKVRMTKEDRTLSVDYRKAIANDPCFYCGEPGEEDDHYQSLANGGTDHWWNLVRACVRCNRRKGPKNGDEFIALLVH